MEFAKALTFPFRGPNVWANAGCLMLSFMVPIAGAMVAQGYLVHLELVLIGNIHADAPRFDFNRLNRYFFRGLWPTLVTLIASLILLPVLFIIIGATLISAVLLHEKPIIMFVVILAGALLYIFSILLFTILLTPMVFKSGLQESFEAAFDWSFVRGFLGGVGWLMIGYFVLLNLISMAVAIVFGCVPIIGYFGMIFVMSFQMQIQAHLMTQLYHEYLARGGKAIPIKPEPIELHAFPVQNPTMTPRTTA